VTWNIKTQPGHSPTEAVSWVRPLPDAALVALIASQLLSSGGGIYRGRHNDANVWQPPRRAGRHGGTTNSSPTAPTRQYSKKSTSTSPACHRDQRYRSLVLSRASSTREHHGLNPKRRRFPGRPTMEMRWHLGILPPWLQKQAGFPRCRCCCCCWQLSSTRGETRWNRYPLVLHLILALKSREAIGINLGW